jgi:hypothetical protein
VITATYSDHPVEDVSVRLTLASPFEVIGSQNTGSDGQAAFDVSKNGTYNAELYLSGYDYEELSIHYTTCPQQAVPPECNASSNCPPSEFCDSGKCKQVLCECGKVANHVCAPYECCANKDCTGGLVCQNNTCVQKTGCSSNADCPDASYCSAGSCLPVAQGACGYVAGHAWHDYACCSDSGCAAGSHCANNACVQNAYVLRNETAFVVGQNATVLLLVNGRPLANTLVKAVSPSGRVFSGYTDANGEFRFVPDAAGQYSMEALGTGQTVLVTASAAAAAGAATLPAVHGAAVCVQLFGICWYWWLLLAIIVAGYIIYTRMSPKGKGAGKPAGPKGQ